MKRRVKRKGPGRRAPRSAPGLALVPVSCPDCGGVLSETQEGPEAQWLYVCQIDHRHSITSLYQAMEERLENTLWAAVVIMKQIDRVYQELLADQQRPADSGGKNIKRRLQELQRQRRAIQEMIMGTHVIESTR